MHNYHLVFEIQQQYVLLKLFFQNFLVHIFQLSCLSEHHQYLKHQFGIELNLGLRRIGYIDPANIGAARTRHDDDIVVEVERAGRLRGGRNGDHGAGGADHRCGQEKLEFHQSRPLQSLDAGLQCER